MTLRELHRALERPMTQAELRAVLAELEQLEEEMGR